jgi:crotonobetainyl-CoA:carnitine CoA-transferase CaiB-like acyl-CoA transferase
MNFQSKPLTGYRVIDLTTYAAGPAVARILADWGADVIKVESLAGDANRYANGSMGWPMAHGTNISWETLNANKRAISLDVRTERGLEIMYQLLETADVFLSSNRLQALQKNRLDWETLSARFPRLIWAHVSGFGQEGPMANDSGFDTICFWAKSGAMIDFAEKDTAPMATPMGFGDYNAGSVLSGAIAAALLQRERTGRGERLSYSLYGQVVWNMTGCLMTTQAGQVSYPKSRKDSPPLANTYRCGDGEWIILTAFEWDRFFPRVCESLECPELPSDSRFRDINAAYANRRVLIEILDEAFAKLDSGEVCARLKDRDVPATRLAHIGDILTDEQALANHYLYRCETRFPDELGTWSIPAPPVQFGGPYPPEHKPAPLLGEQTDEVMREIGIEEDRKLLG